MPTKAELRARMKALRDDARPLQDEIGARRVLDHALHLPAWDRAGCIALYAAFRGELSLQAMAQHVWKYDRIVVFPRVDDFMLRWHQVRSEADLAPGKYGILEPHAYLPEVEPEMVFLPGLAFTRRGARLGFGGGYYDRALEELDAVRVGVCYDEQIVDELPVEPHDLGVQWLLTPSGCSSCGPSW